MEDEITVIKHECFQDKYSWISKKIINHSGIDFYSLGVYLRLQELYELDKPFKDIYQFGRKDYVDKAIENLHNLGLLEWTDTNIKLKGDIE